MIADFSCAGTRFALRIVHSPKDRTRDQAQARITVERLGGAPLIRDAPLDQALEAICARLDELRADGGTAPEFSVTPDTTGTPLSVGVLTLPLGKNYGGNLQAHALMEILRQMGHKPALVNRRHTPDNFAETEAEVAKDDSRPLYVKHSGIAKDIPNHSFVETHITPLTRPFRSTDQMRRNISKYGFDAIISGSDQVWRPRFARATLPDQFMEFLPADDTTTRRISYAASFGTGEWEYDAAEADMARRQLARFDAVSVREDSGVDLCRDHFGVAARHVLDPTMLLRPDQYRQLCTPPLRPEPGKRLLTYILDRNEDKDQVIRTLSDKLDSTAYSIDGLPFEGPDPEAGDKSVEGWLSSFSDADFVVTDSFHGVAFSIVFNKPFIAYGNPNRGMARFTSILQLLGLEDRLVTHAKDLNVDLMQRPVNWDRVNARLNAERAASVAFLRAALAGEATTTPEAPVAAPKPGAAKPGTAKALGFAEEALQMSMKDHERFVGAFARGAGSRSLASARARVMFRAHALEKGLSRADFRAGFGKNAITVLATEMNRWMTAGRDPADPFFVAAAAVMRAYFERHRALDVDVSAFRAAFEAPALEQIDKADMGEGGALEAESLREAVLEAPRDPGFLEVVYGRRSIREFTTEPVRGEDIARAVRIAMQAPSVCNRQAVRVHQFDDAGMIQAALKLQGGFNGYKMPPRLLLVTSDLTSFFFSDERNQAFIDGGLFMMTLLLGLQQVGLGSCSLNTAMNIDREEQIREILGIPEEQVFISFVAVGHFDPSVLVPRSKRLGVEDVLIRHDRPES